VREAVAWRPDVVLSDIGLPGLNGFELARQLRRDPATAAVRLIAVTGYSSDADRRRAAESGFDHLLAKPAEPDALAGLIATP
jgi:two-component system, OmpR family, response regulator